MGIDSSVVPEIKITPPTCNIKDGILYVRQGFDDEFMTIDIANQPDTSKVKSSWDGVVDNSYPPTYDVKEKATIDEYGTVQITHGYSKVDWDGVHDSSSGVVYDGSYPPTYNVRGEILYARDVLTNYIANPPDTSTEPSDLKNTKANIRKIKPDVNSKLKRI
jgi:hypothetical protein